MNRTKNGFKVSILEKKIIADSHGVRRRMKKKKNESSVKKGDGRKNYQINQGERMWRRLARTNTGTVLVDY